MPEPVDRPTPIAALAAGVAAIVHGTDLDEGIGELLGAAIAAVGASSGTVSLQDPDRPDPELALRNARSVVAVAQSYARPEPEKPDDAPRGRMPRYARRDEYAMLRDKLRTLGTWLREAVPGSRFVVYVDSNGHVDREATARAGVTVFGKNTLAITRRHGSWVVLGALITDAELAPTHASPEQPAWDACGLGE